MNPYSQSKENFRIITDKTEFDIPLIHKYLSEESYWAKNIPIEIVKQSIENSLCFGVFHENMQIGFARIISDYTTFAYLADVFILPDFRGKGLSKWLLDVISEHPNLQNLRRWMLMTQNAQAFMSKRAGILLNTPKE